MKHAVKLAEAFQLLDNGPKHGKPKANKNRDGHNRGGGTDKSPSKPGSELRPDEKSRSRSSKKTGGLPDCPYAFCAEKGEKHLIKDCPKSSPEENSKMFDDLKANKYRDGPSKSTRGQKGRSQSDSDSSRSQPKSGGTVGRMATKPIPDSAEAEAPFCPITVSDGVTSLDTTSDGVTSLDTAGRTDEGSDDSIVSSKLAERSVLRGIGCMTSITTVRLRVALKSGEDAQSFSFLRS